MPEHIEDFWPDDIGESDLVTPTALMREQAAFLGQKTSQQVTAEVLTTTEEDVFFIRFYIVASALDNYKYLLFRVQHDITLYPLRIYWGSKVLSVQTQHEFVQYLRGILMDESTRMVVKALLAQVKF